MTIAMQPIYTQTVSGSSTNTITFNSIPQTFTDLKLEVSARGTQSGGGTQDISVWFNSDNSTLYSSTGLTGTNNSSGSYRITSDTKITYALFGTGSDATANTFGSSTLYLPNYTSSNFKSIIADAANENNSSSAYWLRLLAHLYRSTNSITSMSIQAFGGHTFVANSTFTLYGITKG